MANLEGFWTFQHELIFGVPAIHSRHHDDLLPKPSVG